MVLDREVLIGAALIITICLAWVGISLVERISFLPTPTFMNNHLAQEMSACVVVVHHFRFSIPATRVQPVTSTLTNFARRFSMTFNSEYEPFFQPPGWIIGPVWLFYTLL